MALPPDINPDDYEVVHSERLVAEEIPSPFDYGSTTMGVLIGLAVLV
jgi:hypothetical protein